MKIPTPPLLWLVVAGLIVYIMLNSMCHHGPGETTKTTTTTTTHTDTLRLHDTVTYTDHLPGTITEAPKIIHDTFILTQAQIDTAAKHYYDIAIYKRPIKDSNIEGSITDTLTKNTLKGQLLTYRLLKPTTIIENTQTTTNVTTTAKNRWKLYVGGQMYMANNFGLVGQISIANPYGGIYHLGYGKNFDGTAGSNGIFTIGASYLIKLHK